MVKILTQVDEMLQCMRIQYYIIATLLSLMAWIGIFDAARMGYREARHEHLVPNIHLKDIL